jgi:hypothetical protein
MRPDLLQQLVAVHMQHALSMMELDPEDHPLLTDAITSSRNGHTSSSTSSSSSSSALQDISLDGSSLDELAPDFELKLPGVRLNKNQKQVLARLRGLCVLGLAAAQQHPPPTVLMVRDKQGQVG